MRIKGALSGNVGNRDKFAFTNSNAKAYVVSTFPTSIKQPESNLTSSLVLWSSQNWRAEPGSAHDKVRSVCGKGLEQPNRLAGASSGSLFFRFAWASSIKRLLACPFLFGDMAVTVAIFRIEFVD